MPTLGEIQQEVRQSELNPADYVRRKYLRELHEHTKRPVILYASAFTARHLPPRIPLHINQDDLQGFMSALRGIQGNCLDLIIHSPGGEAEATEQIVNYLRSKFDDIRVIVPQSAMSAATMLACAADRIVMGKHSALGPIDPQIGTAVGNIPAQSILDEFQLAQTSIAQGADPAIWAGRVMQYPHGFLIHCQNAIKLSEKLVGDWLEAHMFKGDPAGASKAQHIATWLSNHTNFYTHGRPIGAQKAIDEGLVIDRLEDDQSFQEAVLSVFHATTVTFQSTDSCKIIENHEGVGGHLYAGLTP